MIVVPMLTAVAMVSVPVMVIVPIIMQRDGHGVSVDNIETIRCVGVRDDSDSGVGTDCGAFGMIMTRRSPSAGKSVE